VSSFQQVTVKYRQKFTANTHGSIQEETNTVNYLNVSFSVFPVAAHHVTYSALSTVVCCSTFYTLAFFVVKPVDHGSCIIGHGSLTVTALPSLYLPARQSNLLETDTNEINDKKLTRATGG